MQLSTDKILAEKDGAVGRVTINNPERRNAISLEMWEGMREAFTAFAGDPEVRCVVMNGAGGKAFASGADISQFEKNRANADAAAEYAKVSMGARQVMLGLEKPLIAMIQGFCMGGGLGLAMTADLRIASGDSQFGIPAGRLGIAYDGTNLTNLVGLVGPSKAKEILFTAKRYSAQEAADMGLINRVVPAGDLAAAVAEVTDAIAENAPLSLRASKLTINELMRDYAARDQPLLQELVRACFDSADYQEGRTAFMEKRKPVFTGR
jgi:enoyl-CoA hydratase